MENNEKIYKSSIKSDITKLNLMEKSQKSMHLYFESWSQDDIDDYFGADFNLSNLNEHVELVKYGVQINVNQDELFCFNVTFQIVSSNGDFLCNYYSYFDTQGNLVDNFVDK